MAEVIKTTFQLRRGLASVWERNNPVLATGEPGFEKDTFRLKIGDGILAWNDLPYVGNDNGEDVQIEADDKSIIVEGDILQLFGFEAAEVGAVPSKGEDGKLKWTIPVQLKDLEEIKETLEKQSAALKTIESRLERFGFVSIFDDTVIDYRDNEIRIMFSPESDWVLQKAGEGSQANLYYFGLKIYAPNDSIFGFKEDHSQEIKDQTLYHFENEPFAGIEPDGRKYSIIWLAAASYNEETEKWTYFGEKSSVDHFIGWDYYVEWYDKEDKLVSSESYRINLTNKNCHNYIHDYYTGKLQTKTDLISISRLVADDDTVIIFDGGKVEDIILS